MGRKSTSTASAKVLAGTSTTVSASQSSILKSSFAPSRYQLRIFASVIQSFESQQLRIHDTTTGRLRCQHRIKPKANVTCLDWGQYNPSKSQSSSRKRRKSTVPEDLVLAFGTDESEICMLSPTEGNIVGQLLGGHERGIRAFKFSQQRKNEAWSIGGDGKVVQWDLGENTATRSISLPDPAITTLSQISIESPAVICASTTPFTVSIESAEDVSIQSFDSMKRPIHTLLRSDHERDATAEHFLAADGDRYINVFDIGQKRLVRTLVAASDVVEADLYKGESGYGATWDEQLLAITTKDGLVELFPRPFVQPAARNGDLKSSRKNLTQKASAKVQLVNPDSNKSRAPVIAASLQGPDLLIASVDSGVEISFQKIRWQDEGNGELLFDGVKEITRTRAASSLTTATRSGIKDLGKSQVDESKTVVVNGGPEGSSQAAAIELGDSDDEVSPQEEQSSEDDAASAQDGESEAESGVDSDQEMLDVTGPTEVTSPEEGKEEDVETAEPSFGDILAAKDAGTIVIADAFRPERNEVATVDSGRLSLPTGMSLGTVLTQSLRTNDKNLLEACLHTTDRDIIANTIQRLESSLAGILVGKIAERMARRPGRYGDLQLWIQQLCVAHGAAISTQPEAKAKLKTLFKVLDQRAKTLSPLLLLKGKLDMLDAQLKFRQQLAAQRTSRQADPGDGGMIYIEGEADNWDSDDDVDETDGTTTKKSKKDKKLTLEDLFEAEEDDDEAMPLANGIGHSASESEEDDEDDVGPRHGGLVDDIAEEEDEDEDSEGDDFDSDDKEGKEDSDDDEEEEDSEMDDFIDDASILELHDNGILDDAPAEDEEEEPMKPEKKRRKH